MPSARRIRSARQYSSYLLGLRLHPAEVGTGRSWNRPKLEQAEVGMGRVCAQTWISTVYSHRGWSKWRCSCNTRDHSRPFLPQRVPILSSRFMPPRRAPIGPPRKNIFAVGGLGGPLGARSCYGGPSPAATAVRSGTTRGQGREPRHRSFPLIPPRSHLAAHSRLFRPVPT